MYCMYAIAWNENESQKLEVGRSKVTRVTWNAPRYAAIETEGETWENNFSEIHKCNAELQD